MTLVAQIPATGFRLWMEQITRIGWRIRLAQFLLILIQLAMVMILLRLFEIEPGSGLLRILPLVFIGFVVHAMMPARWRLQFFLLLSILALGVVLGWAAGAAVVTIALALIGICHLRAAFAVRIFLLLVVAGALAVFRGGWMPQLAGVGRPLAEPRLAKLVLPVLGSMFMFRLVIYMYDLRQEERLKDSGKPLKGAMAPALPWARLCYFFLLPNVCFPLFPIVDYRSYRRTYYDTDALMIYQKGVSWICLGLVQLLLYRAVYHYLVPAPEDVQGLAGIVRFMVSSYLVYIRVVGQFHLITGILCLFGFNLPPAHTFYLLASGFTDFWRRARIEWKDFMVKIFYYPTLVPLQRRWGATPALIGATVSVFVATWLLHSYQWFWLQGDFRLSESDGVFWTIVGGCVLMNSLLEARRVRAKMAPELTLRFAVLRAIKTIGMFIFMCVLWSYWSSPSYRIWVSYLTAVENSGPAAYGALGVGLSVLLGIGVLAQFVVARLSPPSNTRSPQASGARVATFWRPGAVVVATGVLLILRLPQAHPPMGNRLAAVIANLSTNQLNAMDQERQESSYYEVLLDEPRSTAARIGAEGTSTGEAGRPQGAGAGEPSTGAAHSAPPKGDPETDR